MNDFNGEENPWPPRSDDDYRQEAVILLGEELADLMSRVRLVVLDADGVLTPGNLVYGPSGEALKEFHSHDGLGLVLARLVGIKRAVLTGRNSNIVERRCRELRFDAIKLGRFDKVEALKEILDETGCRAAETLYMGDDLIDLPAMYEVGCAVSVPAAPQELRDASCYVTTREGGLGAVREVLDLIMKSAGIFGQALVRLQKKESQPTQAEISSDVEKETWQ
ncbi:MAG: HAD hydrolase family protein [Acidobacteria bacterium]|uniref:HAD hydrolase family protein n=1 Tax=Candidatus Polarisedimenticola svalbardensis TaxID=2886004 RepID=A0A8J6XZ73_9BACT|nr:HAD hydrolase family protein [Candidatus Polarisedimenticola svalbardensis]